MSFVFFGVRFFFLRGLFADSCVSVWDLWWRAYSLIYCFGFVGLFVGLFWCGLV